MSDVKPGVVPIGVELIDAFCGGCGSRQVYRDRRNEKLFCARCGRTVKEVRETRQ